MADRVLSTDQAKQTIQDMRRIITGPLLDQLQALNKDGQILSDSNVWDGNRAITFRQDWQETHQKLMAAQRSLEELRNNIEAINRNIMTAGGN